MTKTNGYRNGLGRIARAGAAFLAGICLIACGGSGDKPVKLILDTDIGNDFEDALALSICVKCIDSGDVDLLAICTNKQEDGTLQYVDLMETWMGHTEIPIGKITGGKDGSADPDCARPVAEMTNPDGSPKYPRTITDYDSLLESVDLYRKVLAKSPDKSVYIASIGFSTNLKRLLESGPDQYSKLSGMDLVKKKVKCLAMMAGDFECKGHLEFNVYSDVPAARAVYSDWPTPIIDVPYKIGRQMWLDRDLLEFEWAPDNPLKDSFYKYIPQRLASPLYDTPALISVIEGTHWFTLEKGNVHVEDDGNTVFTPDENGKVSLASLTDAQAEALHAHIVELATAPIQFKD